MTIKQNKENEILCTYDGEIMTVAQYRKRKGVAQFEKRLRQLAKHSAMCEANKTDVRTGELYPVFNEGFPTHNNRRCLYFEKYVLPSDPQLEKDYYNVMQGGKINAEHKEVNCESCGKLFSRKSSNQKYCKRDECIKERKRRANDIQRNSGA